MSGQLIERRAIHRVPPAVPRGDAFGLRAATDTILHRGRLAASVFLLTLGAAVAYLFLAEPVYKANSVLQVDNRVGSTLLPNLPGSGRSSVQPERLEMSGQIEILRSRRLLIPIIEATGADIRVASARRLGFLPVGARHGVEVARFEVAQAQQGRDFWLSVEAGRWALSDEDGQAVAAGEVGRLERFEIGGESAAIEVLAAADLPATRVTVRKHNILKAYEGVLERLRLFEPARDSNVVRIDYEDGNPRRAAALLNGLAAAYLEQTLKYRIDDGTQVLRFLEGQLPALKSRVTKAEEALSAYQRSTTAVPLGIESDGFMRERAELERQLVTLQIKRDQLAQTFTPEHPELAAVIAQMASVQRAVGRLAGGVNRLPAQQRDILRLQRDLQTSSQLYAAMLSHEQELRIAGASWLANARQLDAAVAPVERSRPKPFAVLSVGIGLATILAIAATLVARALRPTVTDAPEFDLQVTPPTLAVIPESVAQQKLMNGRLVTAIEDELGAHRLLARCAPEDPAIESLRSVHLSLVLNARTSAAQVVLITSPSFGAGKAFVASNLAALMAETGKRVLLVEADLRRPGIHRYVGLDEHAPGLSDMLCDERSIDEVIYPDASTKMDVILHGTMLSNPGGLLLSHRLEVALSLLRGRYDHIVIDAAPLLPVGDALAVGRLADCALLVVRAEQSLVQETQEAVRRLERAGVKLEGLLFNCVKRTRLNAPVLT